MRTPVVALALLLASSGRQVHAQEKHYAYQHRIDSLLSERYRSADIDTAYIVRPKTKWTVVGRLNISGSKIEAEGIESGLHFNSVMRAEKKGTLSLAVSYLGFSLSAALNPAKLMGKYRDYELNFNSYGKRFGFDFIYQDAKNFTGWHDAEGKDRMELPAGMVKVKTLNLNAFYVFNSRRFSYPAAFSQSYIQRQSAGSFLLAASGMGQHAKLDWEKLQGFETFAERVNAESQQNPGLKEMKLKMTNIGLGAGYGYNFVPGDGWLLHISALPTFIVYSNASMTFGNDRVPLHYRFPEVIITSRGSVVRQWGNKFVGMSMVFNFTNIGDEDNLAIQHTKWRVRTFFGLRL